MLNQRRQKVSMNKFQAFKGYMETTKKLYISTAVMSKPRLKVDKKITCRNLAVKHGATSKAKAL